MKKRTAIIWIMICCVLTVGIVALDYYRAIFVSSKATEQQKEDKVENTATKEQAVFEEQKLESASICIFGDQLIHENVLNDANCNAGGSGERGDYKKGFNFSPMFEAVKDVISNSDFSICTQNSLVGANDSTDALSGYPLFNAPSKLGKDMVSLGFDAVNIAGNHLLDLSDRGYLNSISAWRKEQIYLIGGYETKEQMDNLEEKVIVVNGIRIGILAYTATTNGLLPQKSTTAIPYYTLNETAVLKDKLKNQVSGLKEISDVVLVLMNWGNQAGFDPSEEQKETAKLVIDAGADLIVGNGAKVIQKIEYIKSENGDRGGVCVYSLGNNLCTMQYMNNLFGGYLSFEVIKENQQARIQNLLFTPVVIHYDKNIRNISIIPLADYNEEQFLNHGSNQLYGIGDYSWYYDTLKQYIPLEYLPAKIRNHW